MIYIYIYIYIYIFIYLFPYILLIQHYPSIFTATLCNMYILWSFPKLLLSSLGGEKSIRMYNKKLPIMLIQ